MSSLVPDITATEIQARERVEGLSLRIEEGEPEMDILKDLPSYNSSNFSRLGSNPVSTTRSNLRHTKTYVRLKRRSEEEIPFQVIVTDSKSFILKELEALVAQKSAAKRKALKRSSACRSETGSSSSSSCKFPRTDMTDDDSADSWSYDSQL